MNPNVDDQVPGPSTLNDPEVDKPSDSALRKRVQFDKSVDEDNESNSEREREERSGSKAAGVRRQSLIGQSGYVTQLLEEHLEDDAQRIPEDEPGRKPIRKQTLAERRVSIKAVEADMKYYMKEATRKSRASISIAGVGSDMKLPTSHSAEKLAELRNLSKLLPDDSRPCSGWKPSHILDDKVQDQIQEERSWVGTYIVGTDYWAPEEEKVAEEKTKEVAFSVDMKRTPWYEMPLRKQSFKESVFRAWKHRSLDKIEALKDEMDEEYEEKRKQRMVAAAHAREEPTTVDVWSQEFKDYFKDISRSSEFSHRGTHMSMVDSDRWLEKAGIIDHTVFTLIHTGFCFLACGGSRHRGLSFDEFTQFLQMISYITGLPLRDLIRRMIACQRKPGQLYAQ